MSQHFEKVQNPSAFIISLCGRNTEDIGFKERRDRQHWDDSKDRSNRQQSWDKSKDHRDRRRSGHFPQTPKQVTLAIRWLIHLIDVSPSCHCVGCRGTAMISPVINEAKAAAHIVTRQTAK